MTPFCCFAEWDPFIWRFQLLLMSSIQFKSSLSLMETKRSSRTCTTRGVAKQHKLTPTLQNTHLEREQRRKCKTPADSVPKPCGDASWTPPAPGSGLPASVSSHGALLRKHEACREAARVWELRKDEHTGVRVEFRLARSRWRSRPSSSHPTSRISARGYESRN